MALSITFLQVLTLILGAAITYPIARTRPTWWIYAISFFIAFPASWALGVIVWAFLFIPENYTTAIASGMTRSVLSAAIGPIIGIIASRRMRKSGADNSKEDNDAFISGFHSIPNEKALQNFSLRELAAELSASKEGSPKRQILENELSRRSISSQAKTSAIISLVSVVVGAFLGAFFTAVSTPINDDISVSGRSVFQNIDLQELEQQIQGRWARVDDGRFIGGDMLISGGLVSEGDGAAIEYYIPEANYSGNWIAFFEKDSPSNDLFSILQFNESRTQMRQIVFFLSEYEATLLSADYIKTN